MRKVLLSMAAILAPGSGMGVSVWADGYRYLSAESGAKVGQWKSYPYQVEPMDAASDPSVHRVVLMSATQMIKTSVIENAVGRTIDVDPLPILIVQPRKEDAVDFVEERIEPMIRDTPRLREKVYKASKKLKKLFRGGMLTITSAGKADNAARRAIGLLCLDEVDKYRLTREGNFIPLARKRLETYKSRGKEIIASSPTFEGSEIDKAYQASDQRELHVPCPLCGKEQSLMKKFRTQVRWDSTLPTVEEQALSARYYCEHCDKPWDERVRRSAIEFGRWIANKPFRGVAGFWISRLYSFSSRLDQIVLDFLQAKDSPEDLRGFINTSLAENFSDQGDTPDWQALVNRREEYAIERSVPKGVLIATAGADVHPNRIEVELVGWGRNRWSWGLRKEIFEGRTSELRGQPGGPPSPWEQLEAFMAELYPHELGGDLKCSLLFVDSGNQTNDVYRWVHSQNNPRIRAIKGVHKGDRPVGAPSPVNVTIAGRVIKSGVNIRSIVVPFFKTELYADLKHQKPTDQQLSEGWRYPTGYCHFPKSKDYDDEHFKQLCAEQLVTHKDRRTGRQKREWQQLRPRNEALDIRVYARAAAWALHVDDFKEAKWRGLEWQLRGSELFRDDEPPAQIAAAEQGADGSADVCNPPAPAPVPRAVAPVVRSIFKASKSRYL